MSRIIVVAAALALAGAAKAGETEPKYGPADPWFKPAAIPSAEAATATDVAPAKMLLFDIENHFGPDGDQTYVEFAGKVLTPDGLSSLGGWQAEWNPDTETVTIHKLNIIRGGQVIDRLPIDKFATLRRETNLEKAMLDGELTAAVQVTDLQVGDIVDFAYTITRKDPILQGRSSGQQRLGGGVEPTLVHFRDGWPSAKPMRFKGTAGLSNAKAETTPDGSVIDMSFTDLKVGTPPENAPSRYKNLGRLEFSQFGDWAEVSSLLWPLFQKASTLAPDSPLRAEAAKIRAQSADPEVRASLALRFVQDQVRYLFVGLDNGGYNPASADETWRRRFGDCKGKTALLLAMLHELGIEAEPIMVHHENGDDLDQRLPWLGVFDHVFVRAWINGRSFWLDGTGSADRDIRTLSQPNFGWGLPVRQAGAQLERLAGEPWVLPMGETVMTIDASQGLATPSKVRVETTLHGGLAVLFSRKVGGLSHDEAQHAFIDAWGKGYGWVDIQGVDWGYNSQAGEFHFSMYGAGKPGAWPLDNSSGAQVFEIDGSGFSKINPLGRPAGQDPNAAFAVAFPLYERSVTLLRLPDGGEGYSLVGDNVDETINGVRYRRLTRFEHGMVVMERSSRAMKAEVTPDQAQIGNARIRTFQPAAAWVRAPLPAASAAKLAGDPEALVSQGYDLLNQDRADRALALFDQALTKNETYIPALVGRADAYAEKGDFEKSLLEYDRAAAANTTPDPQIAAGRGAVLFAAGRYAQAVQVYSDALARTPDAALFRGRAEAFAAMNQLDKAMADAEAALKLEPRNAASWSLRGALHLGRKDMTKALDDFDQAVRIEPDDADNLLGRGLVYASLKQWDRAIAEFDEARRIDPASVRPVQAKADAEVESGRFGAAVLDLDRALDLTPGAPVLLNARCWARAAGGQELDKAAIDCDAAIAADPKTAAFRDSRGLLRLRLGKLDEALADYDAAIAAQPKLATSLYGRGLVRAKRGDASGARADFSAAHAASPDVEEQFAKFGLKP